MCFRPAGSRILNGGGLMILQKKGTTIKDILNAFNYDFDYVSYRIPLNLADFQEKSELLGCENTEFAGCFKTENKKIIPLDYDSYSENEEVVAIEEWSMPEENIKHGLTIVVCAELVSAETFFDALNKSRKAVNIQCACNSLN